MFDWVLELLHGPWAFAVIVGITALDVLLPVLPSETAAITGGIAAANGSQLIQLVLISVAVGAFAGDNAAYWIGRRAQGWTYRWVMRGESGRRRVQWSKRMLQRHGGSLIIVGRFVPGGRTAAMVGSGILGFPCRQFIGYDLAGAAIWAASTTLVGFLGGEAFSQNTPLALAVSCGAAAMAAAAIELVRWVRQRRGGQLSSGVPRSETTRPTPADTGKP